MSNLQLAKFPNGISLPEIERSENREPLLIVYCLLPVDLSTMLPKWEKRHSPFRGSGGKRMPAFYCRTDKHSKKSRHKKLSHSS